MNHQVSPARAICAAIVILFLLACDVGIPLVSQGSPTNTPAPMPPAIATATAPPLAMPTGSLQVTRPTTTTSAGPITIVSPNGGEQWTVGETHPIHWDWIGKFNHARLEYSIDGGATWRTIDASTTNDGSFAWALPNTPSLTCKVKVTDTADPNVFDISNADFTIVQPTISVTKPTGGETYVPGEIRPIHWNVIGKFNAVRLEYSTDGGNTWRTIDANTPNDGLFMWTVPNTSSPNAKVKITDTSNPNAFGISSANFTIGTRPAPNPITPTSPMTGDIWVVGREYYITWASIPGIRSVKIEYSANGGTTWDMVTPNTTNPGYYRWKIPSTPCSNCKVKISDASNPTTFRESDVFTIAPQTIAVTSPRAGDVWVAGRNYYTTWNASGGFGSLKIEYSTNGGSTWDLITGSTPNSGSHSWQVPNIPSLNCKIRITNNENTKVFAVSDTFAIR